MRSNSNSSNTEFYTLDELIRAIFALMDKYNSRPIQVKESAVTVLWDMDTVEIYNGLERIAIHKRSLVT